LTTYARSIMTDCSSNQVGRQGKAMQSRANKAWQGRQGRASHDKADEHLQSAMTTTAAAVDDQGSPSGLGNP